MDEVERGYETFPWMIRIASRVVADAEDFTDFAIESMARNGRSHKECRRACLSQFGQRVAEHRVKTTFAVTDDDRTRYDAEAEAYVRTYFPDLFEDGAHLLRRVEETAADVCNQLETIQDWAAGIGMAPYTERRARNLERLRDRLQKVVDRIVPRTEERKLTAEEAEAEVREDLGLSPRAADQPLPVSGVHDSR